MDYTERGFAIHKFTDHYGKACSLQKSSLASEDCIWLGCAEIGLKKLIPGKGWRDIPLVDDFPYGTTYTANTRMHLTQEQVKELLPMLQKFAETGELE